VDVNRIGAHCAAKPGAWTDNPWRHEHPVVEVGPGERGRSGWNDLALDGRIPDEDLLEAVDESYRLVVEKLPKKLRPEGWDA
jgi:predicted DNA-binding protein (MmcQ/YjbR family)